MSKNLVSKLYAKKLVRELNIKEPPVSYVDGLDYFNLKIEDFAFEDDPRNIDPFFGFCTEDMFPKICGMLDKKNKIIYIHKNLTNSRRRFTVFHELGHFHLPHHKAVKYLYEGEDDAYKKEADAYAAEMLMPEGLFTDDMYSSPLDMNHIIDLADRYSTSVEAICIRFAKLYEGECCFVVYEHKRNPKLDKWEFIIRYCAKSKKFNRFFRSNTILKSHPALYSHYRNESENEIIEAMIPASVFGSSKSFEYFCEIKHIGNFPSNRFIALLRSIPD